MNTLLLKQIAILSAILGAAIGVLTLIPIVKDITFIALILVALQNLLTLAYSCVLGAVVHSLGHKLKLQQR